ncbi:hypothetical protein RclHR1_05910007 [Rhizophagus clarus]|uniref:Uncharacterized protein n=1 Tax=Rhizophagus clarus TaxID=94130 RepID=A0A2Z6RQF4_9GLOM|nr:hypothetical protein RclHR1_05910007 [Rhizophagus clarus]
MTQNLSLEKKIVDRGFIGSCFFNITSGFQMCLGTGVDLSNMGMSFFEVVFFFEIDLGFCRFRHIRFAFQPTYGKFSDIFGRKSTFLFAITTFELL